MRNCCKALSLLLLCVLIGCSSSPEPPPDQVRDPLEQNAIDALREGAVQEIDNALAAALASYRRLDNLPGQWRVHLMQANYYLSQNRLDEARAADTQLQRIAAQLPARRDVAYQSALVRGKIGTDPAAFRQALALAANPLEKAIALTYLGDVATAVATLDPNDSDHPADRAFIAYQYARSTDRALDFMQALHFYRLAQNPRGIADSLLSLAQIAQHKGERAAAQDYGLRAAHALEATGDSERARVIRDWLASL